MTKPFIAARAPFWGVAFPFLVLMGFLSGQNKAHAQTACTIPGTVASCHQLVSRLPWRFDMVEKENDQILFKSSRGKKQPGMPLKISLSVTSHVSQEAATESFSTIGKKADPDMGISYGWDLVTVREKMLFHLHADCTLAEQHFETVVHALTEIVGPPGDPVPGSLHCRCGGGCQSTAKKRE